ncbi:MAG: hypothetical protein Q8J97_07710 [Flavobacteriaceae bacterium]|nr:hypothetical protein [Flavobacteriaceae bacterium]
MDFYTILGFISGGGISALVTSLISLKYAKRTQNLEYTEKLSAFWNKENESQRARLDNMEAQINELYEISCIRKSCAIRKKAI